MGNNVYSAFFREQNPYTFDEIKKSLKIPNDEHVKNLIRTMKSYNILRACKSGLLDYENLSVQDLIFADVKAESKDTVFVFKFVGIVLLGSVVIKCYPKYIDPEIKETKVKEESLILVLKALEKYNKSKTQDVSLYNGEDDNKQFNKLEVALFLLHDYFVHDLYTNQEEIIEINGEGEYLFDRTVEQNMAIMQDGSPYYVEIFTRRNMDNDSDYFRQLHKCILNECSFDLEMTGLLDIFGLSSVEFAESKLEDFGEKEYILNRITSELGNQFITHRQTLLKTLYAFVESEYGNETNFNLELLGTTSFNLVWETACGEIFGNVKNSKIADLRKQGKLPDITNTIFDEKDKIIELIENARWEINNKVLETTETLEPDIITLDPESKGFYILDGKYYMINPKEESNKIYNQPGIQDVVKQFAYQKAYHNFIQEYNFSKIGNAFLFPQKYSVSKEKNKKILFSGTVQLDLMQYYAFKLLAPIQILELNPNFVFENYITNSNCEDELFKSDMICSINEESVFEEVSLKERAEDSMLGYLKPDHYTQIVKKIKEENVSQVPFYFYAFDNYNKQYVISPKTLDCKLFLGYAMKNDDLIVGDIKSNIRLFGKDLLKQVLKNRGYTKESFGAKTYYYLEISNPKIMKASEVSKYGLDINSIKKNAIITNFAPKVIKDE